MLRMDSSGRLDEISDLRVFVPAESELASREEPLTNHDSLPSLRAVNGVPTTERLVGIPHNAKSGVRGPRGRERFPSFGFWI